MKAAFIGRFQPFHQGHHHAIKRCREEFDELEIVIGSSGESRTEENPLTAEEREEIIRNCFPKMEIKYLEDEERGDEGNRLWAEKLDRKLDAEVLVTHNELVKSLAEEHTNLEVREHEMHEEDLYSGTEVRRRIRSGEEWRYLVPGCAKETIEDKIEHIKESGVQYEFEPGWNPENTHNS